MEASSLKQKTAKGLFWGAFSNGVQQIISVVFGIWLARILTADDYGLVGMLAIFTALCNVILNSGFVVALTNKKEVEHRDYNAIFWFTFFVGLLLYIFLFISAPSIASFYERSELINLSRVLFVTVFINGLAMVPHIIMYKDLMAKHRSITDVVSVSVSFIVSLIIALKGYAYWAIVAQRVVQSLVGLILRYTFTKWVPVFKLDFTPIKQLWAFSSKLFAASFFGEISNNLFSVLLGKLYNAQQVGFYSQGQKWMTIGSQLTGGMMEYVAQPVLVQVNEDKGRQVSVLRKLIRMGAFLSFPLLLGLAFIAEEFVFLALGEKWLPSVPFLQLFCIWGTMRFLWSLYGNLVITKGKSNWHLYGTIAIGLMQLLSVLLTSPWGIFPMIIVYIFCSFIGLFIWHGYVNRLVGLKLMDLLRDILPYLGVTLICFFVAWLLTRNIVNLYGLIIAKITISVVLYVLLLKYSRSVIFQESVSFLLDSLKKRTRFRQ